MIYFKIGYNTKIIYLYLKVNNFSLILEEKNYLEKEIIGKNLEEAKSLCKYCIIKVLKEDGKKLFGTCDIYIYNLTD